jgi:hypothetical protein
MAFGLRSDLEGQHCKGSGENGTLYHAPTSLQTKKSRKKLVRLQGMQKTLAEKPVASEEVCPLLREPLNAVRGFLALARRDAQAGWWVIVAPNANEQGHGTGFDVSP